MSRETVILKPILKRIVQNYSYFLHKYVVYGEANISRSQNEISHLWQSRIRISQMSENGLISVSKNIGFIYCLRSCNHCYVNIVFFESNIDVLLELEHIVEYTYNNV